MALITCPECGKEVSEKADSCPNCGNPLQNNNNQKFCKHCGATIDKECVVCPQCGKQVEGLNYNNDKNIVINNNNTAAATTTTIVQPIGYGRPKNKWTAFLLCLFLGFLGIHKFYEGKILFGILYIVTLGFCGVGVLIDLILILLKPNPYFV